MHRPSSVEAQQRARLAHRLVGAAFAAATVWFAVGFVGALLQQRVATALVLYGIVYGAAAYGLLAVRPWARTLALVVSAANIAIGALGVVGSLAAGRPPGLFTVLFLAANLAVASLLSRRVFMLPERY